MTEASDAFARDGAVLIKGLLDPGQVDTLRAGIDKNLSGLSGKAIVASQDGEAVRFIEDFCNWQHIPEYQEVIFNPDLASKAAELMQSRNVRLHHDHLLVKEAGTRQRTPWHQDQPYYNIEGRQNISFWIPVDRVPRASTLEFVAGSHLGPWLMPRTFMSNEARWFPEGSLADLPDIDGHRRDFEILAWELEPGDAVAFHMLTLHSAAGAETRRRVFSVRFIGDDARHAPRRWQTSPEFPGLGARLPEGAEFDDALFPIVWPADSVADEAA